MFVKPASEDVIILDPITKRRMSAEGWDVPVNAFWCHLMQDGDIIECDQPSEQQPQDEVSHDEQQVHHEEHHQEWHEENH